MINVTRSSMPPFEEYCNEIKGIWDSRILTNCGPLHEKLKAQLEERLMVRHVELFTNGHMAIELALNALELEGEVITTPFTFASTTNAIIRNGLTPVFCDIEPDSFTMDPAGIEALITERTSAILPVHVYGNICDVEAIGSIAKKYGLKVIYDACHAFGETYNGRGAGSFGDASAFSFHATKVFNTIEGGCIATENEALAKKLAFLRNFGMTGPEEADFVGPNAKMNEFAAAMGICNLRHLDEEIAKRRRAAERYFERLSGVDGIRLNPVQRGVNSNYAYFPVLFDPEAFGADRDRVQAVLAGHNVRARKYFHPLTSSFSAHQGRFDPSKTPVALEISKRVLALPLFADLTPEDADAIADVILSLKK